MGERRCRYCGGPLPMGAPASLKYCSERCRRDCQNERRRDERAEAREARAAGKAMADPWARCDLDDWTAEDILANALLDPNPLSAEAEFFAGPLITARPIKKAKASWKDRWLSLL